MTSIFLKILELSLIGGYVILFVLAARLLLRKSPKWCSYILWSVVFLRLILPVVPELNFSLVPAQMQLSQSFGNEMQEIGESTQVQNDVAENVMGDVPDNSTANLPNTNIGDISSDKAEMPTNVALSAPTANITAQSQSGAGELREISNTPNEPNTGLDAEAVLQVLAYIWLAGVVVAGSYHLVSYYKFKASLKGAVQVENGVYEIKGKHVSFVMGVLRPAIYLSDSLDAASRKVVLCHERVHLKRKDYLIKPLALGISCVHWFNPLVWLAFYLMGKDCEMSCDEKVVSLLGEESKKIYSYTLLDEATQGERLKYKRENMCAVLSFGEESIKSRIKHVLNFKKAPVWLVTGTVVVLLLLMVGLLSNRKETGYSASISMACSAKEYEQNEDGAFLTLTIYEDKENEMDVVVQVTDEKLQEQLAETEVSDVIGVHLLLNVPKDVLKERHVDVNTVNGFYFLEDSYYHPYLTLGSISLGSENTISINNEEDITVFQLVPEEALKKWATAYTERDGNALYALSHDKEAFENWNMVTVLEEGYAFGDSSPWPWQYDYEIYYEEGEEEAIIRYWMRDSAPVLYPEEETVKLVKDGDLYYVDHQKMVSHSTIDTLDELKEAYVRDEDDINGNLGRMSDENAWYGWTDSTGYDKDYMRTILFHVEKGTNPDYYDAYKDPVTAAKLMLNLGEGSGEVTGYLHEADNQKTLGEGTYGVPGEGTVVNVTYTFAADNSVVQIPMVLAEESQGLWALSAGDFTKAYKYIRGALPADANFLARNVIEEIDFGEGTVYQISDYGIYEVSADRFERIYARNMANVKYDYVYEDGTCYLYYPVDSQYKEGNLETAYDSLCKINLTTGETYTFPFEAAAYLADEKASMNIVGGFVTLYGVSVSNGPYSLADAGKVWNGKTTAELSDAEKDEYGAANREYILSHPDEVVRLGNRYKRQTDAFVDMNGDGKTERIAIGVSQENGSYFPNDSFVLKLDDWEEKRYASNRHNEIWAISPDGENIYIALYEDGPSGDPKTTFLRYYDGKLVDAGSVSCSIYQLPMEDGIIRTYDRVDLIQTDFVLANYAFDEKGNLQQLPQEIYEYGSWEPEEGFRLLKEMTLYTEPGGEETFTLQPQIVYFEQVDGSLKWVKMRGNNGQTGWFEVTGVCEVYGIDSTEWFEGLSFAG